MDLQTASRSRHVRANFLPLTLVSTNCCNAVGVLLLVSSVVSLILSNHHSYGAGRRLNSTERYGNESGGRSIAVARAPLTPPAERRESEDPSNGSARSWGESGDEDAADEGHEDQPDRAAGTWRQRRSQNPILYGYSNRRTQNAAHSFLKRYSSFAKYVVETSGTSDTLPLPVVTPVGYRTLLSIPLITIIGVQKGGTTNLRRNLLTHPLVSGMPNEIHFFDRHPDNYPKLGIWPGDSHAEKLSAGVIGHVLSEYARACLEQGISSKHPAGESALARGVVVESSPRYMLSPMAPYRMRMVRANAKLVVVLRDPTDRYFSQLRMIMCKKHPDPGFISQKSMIERFFHPPGWAEEYIARAEGHYQPYTPVCRGENATENDLWACNRQLQPQNPVHRGLYADQLERWFRVFDRSKIMIIDSAEMFADFIGTVQSVAEFAELPAHEFEYDAHEFSGDCAGSKHPGSTFFSEGGLYDRMLADEEVFREWYRPHNDRLFRLLDRDFGWND